MVSSEKVETSWVLYFVGQKQTYGLNTLLSSVYVVSHKQIFASVFMWVANGVEVAQKINILSMNVAKNLNGRLKFKQNAFLFENDCTAYNQELYLLLAKNFVYDHCVVKSALFLFEFLQLFDDNIQLLHFIIIRHTASPTCRPLGRWTFITRIDFVSRPWMGR